MNIVFRFVGHDPDTGIIDQMIDSLFSRAPFTGNEDAFQIWHHNERTEVSGTPDLSKNCFTICDHDGTCDLPNEVDVSVCYAACRAYAMLGSYNGKGMGTESTVSTEDRTSYVFVHEFAHQFGGLRDEYGEAGKDNYSGKPNCADTQEQAKQWWQDLFGISQGEPGCSYDDENYKPVKDTIMEGDGDNEFGVVNEYYLLRKICLFEGACGNTGSSSSVTSTGSSVSSAASLPISSAQNSGQNSIVTSVASSSLSVPSSVSSSLSGATVLSDSSASVTASQESSFPDEFPQYPVLCVDLERADNDEFVIVNYLAEMRFAPVGRTYADGRLLRITIGNREYSTLFRDQQLLISESFGDPSAEQLTQIIPLDEVSVCLDLDPEHVIISDGHIVLLNPPPNPNGQQQQQGEIQPEATTDECSGEPLCPEEGNCTCQIQLNHGGTYGCPLYQQ